MDPRLSPREPILTLPGALTAYVVLLIAIHAVRTLLLPIEWDYWVLEVFSFIPKRYDTSLLAIPIAGGTGAKVWTFLT
ncbi:MAG: rhomboid family intramembrane serine protease, partial [Xanthobacteraceae bacterium]